MSEEFTSGVNGLTVRLLLLLLFRCTRSIYLFFFIIYFFNSSAGCLSGLRAGSSVQAVAQCDGANCFRFRFVSNSFLVGYDDISSLFCVFVVL